MAVRGSPAKGVGWGNWREGSNPSFSAKIALHHQVRRYFSLDKRRRGCPLTALFPTSARFFRLYANNNACNNAIYQYARPRADEIQKYIIYIENSDYE